MVNSSRTLQTAVVSIRGETGRTELAEGLVVLHHTGGVSRALGCCTRVLALVLDARLPTGTALVFEADGGGGVAAGGTDTDSLVVEHLALLACSADGGGAAGVLAPSVVTGLVGGAVVVDAALNLTIWAGERALLVDNQAVLAGTDGLVARHPALLVEGTGLGRARVVTLPVLGVTGRFQGTVLVCPAPHGSGRSRWQRLDWNRRLVASGICATPHVGTSNKALWALASGLVDDHLADGVVSASSS